jgi:hypothetical protein
MQTVLFVVKVHLLLLLFFLSFATIYGTFFVYQELIQNIFSDEEKYILHFVFALGSIINLTASTGLLFKAFD